jgi:hypothetical protein
MSHRGSTVAVHWSPSTTSAWAESPGTDRKGELP